MKRLFIIQAFVALIALTLSACETVSQVEVSVMPITLTSGLDRQARELIAYVLKEPESARYREMRAWKLSNGDIAVCGAMNARNSFGGYTGFKGLYIRFEPGPSPTRKQMHTGTNALYVCGVLESGQNIKI